MRLHSKDRLCGRGWAIPLAFALAFSIANVCIAQMAGGGGGGNGGRGGGPNDSGGDNPAADSRATGAISGWIMNYKAPKEGDPEDILAYMTVKPQEGRPVKIIVLRDEPVSIELGERKDFAPEEYADVLTKGIYCNCTWKVTERKKDPGDKKGKTYFVLSRVGFDNFEVTGKIEEISEDMVVIKGKPINDRPWPDAPQKKDNPRRGTGTEKAQKVFSKKLKLRVFDDVTRFKDSDNQELDISDFEPKQTVSALVVYGRRGGIIIDLKSPSKKEGGDSGEGKGGGRGGRPGM